MVYGEYVREVIIPRLYSQSLGTFTEVSIWFDCQFDAENFINELVCTRQLVNTDKDHNSDICCPKTGKTYNLTKIIYELRDDVIPTIVINLNICPILPIFDFEINCLYYKYRDVKCQNIKIELQTNSAHTVLRNARNKKTEMVPSYIKFLSSCGNYDFFAKMIRSNYLYKGWTILINGEVLPDDFPRPGLWLYRMCTRK